MKNQNNRIILSIESSSSVCSVCISVDDRIVSEYSIFERNIHDRLLADTIKILISNLKISFNEIDALAISSGPGSFTGLRIGFAVAKGICFDNKMKLIAVPTLKAIANAQIEIAKLTSKEIIMPVIYSHDDFFYYQSFDLNLKELGEVGIIKKEEIKHMLSNKTIIVGPSAQMIKEDIPEICTKLTSSTISKLASKYYDEDLFSEPASVAPDYYQKFKIKEK